MTAPRCFPCTRLVAGLLALALAAGPMACHSWYRIQAGDLVTGKEDQNHDLELTYADGFVVLEEPYQLDYPRVTGRIIRATGTPMGKDPEYYKGRLVVGQIGTFDLERAQLVRLHKVSPWKAVGWSVGIPVGMALIILATKQSCPFVFVDEGQGERLVGEGYPSAIYRAIQREDLLDLAVGGTDSLRLRLANLVDETQYTDRLDLLAVEHAPGTRALATWDAKVVVVGAPRAPLQASDLGGGDCLPAVAAVGGGRWSTDLQAVSLQKHPPLREGLEARFAAPGGRPVLEVAFRSTRWLEVVTGRYFAAMGDRFPDLLERLNAAEGREIQAWRHKEGVDLRVEVLRQGTWTLLGHVHPTGASADRRVALPLPGDWPASEPVQVRLSGGTGFWQVDALALSTLVEAAPPATPVAPSEALDQAGRDQRGALAAVDGQFQVLAAPGEAVATRFDLPPRPPSRARTVFLRIHGYYNPHTPVFPKKALVALNRMLTEEGAFVRFGLDFYRGNRDRFHGTSEGAGRP